MISYFTFGQSHVHRVHGKTFDCDCVVKIEAEDAGKARDIMFRYFDYKWAFQYDNNPPDMAYFPRGIMEVQV